MKKLYTKAKKTFSKILGFLYVLVVWIIKPKVKENNKKNLIILTGNLGDALMSIEAINVLKDYYKSKSEKTYIVTSTNNWTFLSKVSDIKDFEFLDINFPYSSTGTSFKEVIQSVGQIKKYKFNNIVITWSNSPIGKYIVAAAPHINSWGVFDDIDRNPIKPKFFFERAFTKKIMVSIDTQEMRRYALMLEQIGIRDYKVKIHRTPIQKGTTLVKPKKEYITIAMDSMSPERRWPINNYEELIKKLLHEYKYDICCTGGATAAIVYEKCVENLNNEQVKRINNYILKTNQEEWIELLRGAKFHIGVDSGSIHVAASVGTPAFCLAGYWDGHRVFPYDVDEPNKGTFVPIPVYRSDVSSDNLKCYGCLSIHGHRGIGNPECFKGCQNGDSTICLLKISARSVVLSLKNNMETIENISYDRSQSD